MEKKYIFKLVETARALLNHKTRFPQLAREFRKKKNNSQRRAAVEEFLRALLIPKTRLAASVT